MLDAVTAAARAARTDATAGKDAGYRQIAVEYIDALRADLGGTFTLTKKWPDVDLLWPHSDLDLRIVLDEAPADWIALNDGIARSHRRVVEVEPVRRRILEHPPGWVFLRDELDRGLVPAAELATWSNVSGDPTAVTAWQTRNADRPWSAEDERFYLGILRGRIRGRYDLAADSADNIVTARDRYGVHCAIWHFLAPILFAHTALTACCRPAGKVAVMRRHPVAEIRDMLDIVTSDHPGTADAAMVLRCATRLVDAFCPIPAARTSDHDRGPTRAELIGALGVLRCRIARYAYYLNPPAGVVTDYLVDREGKDLYAATATLGAAASVLTAEPRRLIHRFLDLVPAPPTSRASLTEFLRRLRTEDSLVNTLFSLPLGGLEPSR